MIVGRELGRDDSTGGCAPRICITSLLPWQDRHIILSNSIQIGSRCRLLVASRKDDLLQLSTPLPGHDDDTKDAEAGEVQRPQARRPPLTPPLCWHPTQMSTNIFTPGYILKHPNDFLGPQIASVIIQGVELGVIGNQAIRYFSSIYYGGKRESAYVKWTVFVTLVIMMYVAILRLVLEGA